MNTIEQTNEIVRRAIVAVRIERTPLTMGQLYDALNFRRNARAYTMPKWEKEAWGRFYYTEMNFFEKKEAINRMRLTLNQLT